MDINIAEHDCTLVQRVTWCYVPFWEHLADISKQIICSGNKWHSFTNMDTEMKGGGCRVMCSGIFCHWHSKNITLSNHKRICGMIYLYNYHF